MSKPKKVALAYSGGLDTSVIIPWLKENYQCEVVAVCGDIGQGADELAGLEEKARKTGASEVVITDAREEFVSQYLWKLVRSGAVYEYKYLLGTSVARPLLAKIQVEAALADGLRRPCARLHRQGQRPGSFRAHLQGAGAASGGHRAVARMGHFDSRESALEYAAKHNVPVSQSTKKIYSRDRNIWHISHEGGSIENPANPAPDDCWMITASPQDAPDQSEDVSIGFEQGVPVSLDGRKLGAVELLETLNKLGAKHGVGRIDLVENRFVGMKSRGCYETPGGTLLVPRTASWNAWCSTATRCTTSRSWPLITPRWCTTAYGLRRCARRWTRSSIR